jgi:hypothetical protein
LADAFSQDKVSELSALADEENSTLKLKIASFSSRTEKNCSDLSKKLDGIKKAYHDRSQQIMRRAKANTQKYYLSISTLIKRIDSVQRLQNLKHRGVSLLQRKTKTATQRMKLIREWQVAEVITLKKIILQLKNTVKWTLLLH